MDLLTICSVKGEEGIGGQCFPVGDQQDSFSDLGAQEDAQDAGGEDEEYFCDHRTKVGASPGDCIYICKGMVGPGGKMNGQLVANCLRCPFNGMRRCYGRTTL